ncbi:MAG: hypothetical protein F4Y84_19470 [Caldilineaceae bacterium SB0665_bin_25]|nr:hypothetical protein [Caldilineaceae bacterium SB0665_bin_25]
MTDDEDLFAGWGSGAALDGEAEALAAVLGELRAGIVALQADMAQRLQALEASTGRAVGGVRSAIEADYVGEMTRLCELVRSVDERLLGLEQRFGKDGQVIQALRDGVQDAKGAAGESRRAMDEARALGHHLDGMINRRRQRSDQDSALKRRFFTGVATGLIAVLLILVMLPRGLEDRFARWIMAETAYDAGWRMFDAYSNDYANRMWRYTWIETREGHDTHTQACRDRALDTGLFVWCNVLFKPRDWRNQTPPPPPQ